jgi:hypothetical protein
LKAAAHLPKARGVIPYVVPCGAKKMKNVDWISGMPGPVKRFTYMDELLNKPVVKGGVIVCILTPGSL